MWKAYTHALSLTALVVGCIAVSKPILEVSGGLAIIAGFFIYYSTVTQNVKWFIAGESVIYIALGVFYVKVLVIFTPLLFAMLLISLYMFYKTLRTIVNLEFD